MRRTRHLPFATSTAAILLAICAAGAYAYNPPAGGEEWNDVVSPTFLGGRADVTDTNAVMGDSVNPAVSGLKERPTVGGYYALLIGPEDEASPSVGHIVAIDGDLPTRVGVLGANLMYVDSRLTSLDFGRLVRARVTYARDLFPRLLIGAGANLTVGSADRFFLALAADIGFVHLIDRFRWGFTMQTLGTGYNPHDVDDGGESITGFPSIFSPAAGFSFDAYRSEDLAVRLAAGVATPRFQNVRAGGSVRVDYRSSFSATLGTRYDLHQSGLTDETEKRGWIPSFGFAVNVTQLLRDLEGEDDPDLAEEAVGAISVSPLTGNAVALGFGASVPIGGADQAPPEIAVAYDETEFISPNNDGRFDDLILPIEIEDESLISGYVLVIQEESGQVVRRIENKDERPELRFNALVQEIREGETGILIPEQLRWDGRGDDGQEVADGRYVFFLESWDDRGNRGASEDFEVIVDTTAPTVRVVPPTELIFSPNGDGNKDQIAFEQEGSAEQSVVGLITDGMGNQIRSLDWSEEEPVDFVWDGTDETGTVVPDGVYTYTVTSTDAAGNSTTATVDNLIVNTETQSVFVTTDSNGFSPNGDSIQETVRFDIVVSESEGLESWTFDIVDATGGVARTYSGQTVPDAPIVWNGSDTEGNRTQGLYRGVLRAEYRNGGRPSAESSAVLLDIEPPVVVVDPSPVPFSPDNDGVADDLFIGIEVNDASEIADWQLSIFDPREELFARFSGTGRPRSELIWDGLSDEGELVQAAEDYDYVFEIRDARGNAGETSGTIPVDVLVIREDGRLKIRISNITFAPNSPQYVTDDVDRFEKNIEIINRIAEILSRYDRYQVRIEGHAVNITGTEREQEEELVPLSRARAETVRRSLVERGLDPDRFSVVGVGGTDPIVPHTDLENRWQNRRVEFILLR